MRREWPGIDALRLDKFYLFIRRFINCLFHLLKNNGFDVQITNSFMCVLENETFLANDKFLGNGVSYHVVSVFLDEFKVFLPVGVEVLEVVFRPFFAVMGKSRDKVLVGKVKCSVFDVLLKMGRELLVRRKMGDLDVDIGEETVNFGAIALVLGFSGKLYDLGSSPDCLQWNKKILFGLHGQFLKLEKDLKASGIEVLISVPVVKDDNEVPQLIPIDDMNNSSKNNKKAKKGSDGSKKKSKKKNGTLTNEEDDKENENVVIANGGSLIDEMTTDGNVVPFNESVISNLQMQFEKVAAEVGMEKDGASSIDSPKIKKRKRGRSKDGREPRNRSENATVEADAAAKSGEKSAKKVRFSIKNNLVWKPQSPMPPQSLRLPPSATPRGSALKKGIPPGPIREMPSATKKVGKQKKGRKVMKTVSPAIKRLRKLQALSI